MLGIGMGELLVVRTWVMLVTTRLGIRVVSLICLHVARLAGIQLAWHPNQIRDSSRARPED